MKPNESELATEVPHISVDLLGSFGVTVQQAYKMAVIFYKNQERTNPVSTDYLCKLRFMALSKQAKYGTYRDEVVDCGWFDIMGNEAKKTWKKISDLSSEQAMLEFVRLLDVICPSFRAQLEVKRKEETNERIQKTTDNEQPKNTNEQTNNFHLNDLVDNASIRAQEVLEQFEQQKRQIQEALNKQTYHQFLAYAQQTHPGEAAKQEQLINQLQGQHYQQYISQVYAQAQAASQAAVANSMSTLSDTTPNIDPEKGIHLSAGVDHSNHSPMPNGRVRDVDELAEETAGESDLSDEDVESPPNPKVAPASMWTSKNVQEFKDSIKKEGTEGVLKIGHGETVTVRVPTHPEGNSLVWDFATDYYDLGFGVYFEWTIAETNQVTVQVEESEDEFEEDEAVVGEGRTGGGGPPNDDVEAEAAKKQKDMNKPRVDEIIPVPPFALFLPLIFHFFRRSEGTATRRCFLGLMFIPGRAFIFSNSTIRILYGDQKRYIIESSTASDKHSISNPLLFLNYTTP